MLVLIIDGDEIHCRTNPKLSREQITETVLGALDKMEKAPEKPAKKRMQHLKYEHGELVPDLSHCDSCGQKIRAQARKKAA